MNSPSEARAKILQKFEIRAQKFGILKCFEAVNVENFEGTGFENEYFDAFSSFKC